MGKIKLAKKTLKKIAKISKATRAKKTLNKGVKAAKKGLSTGKSYIKNNKRKIAKVGGAMAGSAAAGYVVGRKSKKKNKRRK